MAQQLSVKTRGGASPQGKPRVYFCCHPGDFAQYFDAISDEILAISSCAVYYYADDVPPDEDYLADLSQMQLFVMPVTTKLLTQPNRAIECEFSYAIAHHIPVLPLMQESGLAELFNRKCGDLQYLDKNERDATTIGYDVKLRKYLESVLIGDETASRVRAAFDAYIFLSYRKKDRKYAQELMRLIHANDFCRDIAIWYDEFLTPGENFNDAIRSAMEQSRLFALAVTPNLVNEENYVMTVEYPMAREAGKPILAAELVPTDRIELRGKYENIPDPVDARQTDGLADILGEHLKGIAMRENDADPQHNFFIGLAYLGGIDVEVDHARAVALITASAEAGLTEAMEKLADMYHTGEGVERNYHTEIMWLERLADQAKEAYERDGGEEAGKKYYTRLRAEGNARYALKQLAEAKTCYGRALKVQQELIQETETTDVRFALPFNYMALGRIAAEEGDLTSAKAHFKCGLEISEALAQETDAKRARRSLSFCCGFLGKIAVDEGNFVLAKEHYIRSLDILEALSRETGRSQDRRHVAVVCGQLGSLAWAEGNLASAREYYHRDFAICEVLERETGTIESRRDLGVACQKLGDIARAEGDLTLAREYYHRNFAICEVLERETGTIESRRDLGVVCLKLGEIAQAKEDLDSARKYYRRDFAICETLERETGTIESRRDLGVVCLKLGNISRAEGDLTSAKEYYRRGFTIFEALEREAGTIESRRDLGVTCLKLGEIAQAEGDLSSAKEYYRRGFTIFEALEREAGTIETRRDLGVVCQKLGEIAQAEGDLASAKEYYRRGFTIFEALVRETGKIATRRDLEGLCLKLGDIAQAEGDLTSAKEYYRRNFAIWKALEQETGTIESRRNLSTVCQKLGEICRQMKQFEEAKRYCQDACMLCDKLIAEIGDSWDQWTLVAVYLCLGDIAGAELDRQSNRAYYQKALPLLEELTLDSDCVAHRRALAEFYCSLSQLTYDVEMLRKSDAIMCELAELCPDDPVLAQRRQYVKGLLDLYAPPPKPGFFKRLFGRKKKEQ